MVWPAQLGGGTVSFRSVALRRIRNDKDVVDDDDDDDQVDDDVLDDDDECER